MNDDGLSKKMTSEKGRVKGEIPSAMGINQVFMGEIKPESFSDMVKLYKKDIQLSEGTDFDTNLKNTWLIIINKALLKGEGNEEQRRFFVYEQLNLEQNFAHLDNFFELLAITNSIDDAEKSKIVNEYLKKNKAAVKQIVWQTPEEKAEMETKLVLAGRSYGILHPSK
ncbi:hypothetical protein [Flavobacterium sp. C4GT6]|uniref:hypothetical protein n=1 Tax=Flavobacterium sp. C4GT6 TaxID=3103818 RepID=UPI002ED5CAD4